MSSNEPASFDEAECSPRWREAMTAEMEAIEYNKTWSLADLPPGRHAIGLKWVLKEKRDKQRPVSKHKVHLVVKGYTQRQGIDYDEFVCSGGTAGLGAHAHRPRSARGVGDSPKWTSSRRSSMGTYRKRSM